jgi:hypothetical protein
MGTMRNNDEILKDKEEAKKIIDECLKGLERSNPEIRAKAFRQAQALLIRKHWDIMYSRDKERAQETLKFLANDGQGIFNLNLEYMTWQEYQLAQER